MCGIFLYVSYHSNRIYSKLIEDKFEKIKHRGPDTSSFRCLKGDDYDIYIGFHRLKINDLSNLGDQPFVNDNDKQFFICNGEIYNCLDLIEEYKESVNIKSSSDCEIIYELFNKNVKSKYDICNDIDGVFAFIYVDLIKQTITIARDPIGVRSLYIGYDFEEWNNFGICSEAKSLINITDKIEYFKPGTISTFDLKQRCIVETIKYSNLTNFNTIYGSKMFDYNFCKKNIFDVLNNAVNKRMHSDRNIACLLSGGLDSSIICALVAKNMKDKNMDVKKLHTFCIGMKGATDLEHAKNVAEHIGTTHHEVIIDKNDLLRSIDDTIIQIESYDITTVRASTPMYFLSKYIKSLSDLDIAVLFSGEGSDELSGSYLYFHNAPDHKNFIDETKRLVNSLYKYDVLRADKSTSGAGLELRVPFLDKYFVSSYINIDPSFKMKNGIEKFILRDTFKEFLPHSVVWRTKEAFSDGVSKIEESWHTIIQNYCSNQNLSEESYYKKIFDYHYPNQRHLIPCYWMPKWTIAKCPSARELDIYNTKK